MNTLSNFDTPRDTLTWALSAIHELDTVCLEFINHPNSFEHLHYFDSETGNNIQKLRLIGNLPQDVARKSTEALSNIRHSFDQIMYAACCAINKKPKESVYFPWATNPTDLEFRLGATSPNSNKPGKSVKTPKIPEEFWAVLREKEPYYQSSTYVGGDDIIRALAHLANKKHTVKLAATASISNIRHGSYSGSIKAGESLSLSGGKWDAQKNEIIISSYPAGITTNNFYEVTAYIGFNEDVPLEMAPLGDTLMLFWGKCQSTLQALEQESIKILSA